jgi:hypothetical protein
MPSSSCSSPLKRIYYLDLGPQTGSALDLPFYETVLSGASAKAWADWAEARFHKFCNDIASGAFLSLMDDGTGAAG